MMGSSLAQAESYEVCVEKYTDASGQRSASFNDCKGNNYYFNPRAARSSSVTSGSDRRGRVRVVDESTYAVDRWCDDSGCYRVRNRQDMCILEVTGEVVPCQ
ncbi:Uncharacterised protein [Leminorella richardii]|uniref:Uncharacterized protein n=2 Tax=Leminorella richardii TaxID=158841 RepID=A0A2X4V8Q5_9GAMM|nr:Uncharacterised protein [Leminorella richardii]